MKSDYLLSGGTAEFHLLVHVRPSLKKQFDYPEGTGLVALSDDTIRERLPALAKANLRRLCIIFDAEDKIAQFRWTRLKRVLEDVGYSGLEEQMDQRGVVLEAPELPKVGVWIMPDNVSPGMIEDFYLRAIPEGDREMLRARGFVDGIPDDQRLFGRKVSKASLGVWLAIQEDPMSPGQSISRNLIQPDAGLLPTFNNWLDRLFAD